MPIPLPSYFWSQDQNIDRRTTEQDEYNRSTFNALTNITLFLLGGTEGDPSVLEDFQVKDFALSKTSNPIQSFRFRHGFGKVATSYRVLLAQANGGGAVTVEWPGRDTAVADLPDPGVDDDTFITLSFTGRADYIIRVTFDPILKQNIDDGNVEGPS